MKDLRSTFRQLAVAKTSSLKEKGEKKYQRLLELMKVRVGYQKVNEFFSDIERSSSTYFTVLQPLIKVFKGTPIKLSKKDECLFSAASLRWGQRETLENCSELIWDAYLHAFLISPLISTPSLAMDGNAEFYGTKSDKEREKPLRPDRAIGMPKDYVNLRWADVGVGMAKLSDDISETKPNSTTQKEYKLLYQGAIAAYQKLNLRLALTEDGKALAHPHPLIFCNSFVGLDYQLSIVYWDKNAKSLSVAVLPKISMTSENEFKLVYSLRCQILRLVMKANIELKNHFKLDLPSRKPREDLWVYSYCLCGDVEKHDFMYDCDECGQFYHIECLKELAKPFIWEPLKDPKRLQCPECMPPLQANGDFTANRPNNSGDDGNENVNLDHLAMIECIRKSSHGEVWRCKDQNGKQFVAKMVTKPFLGDIEAAMLRVTANQKHVVRLLNHTVSPTAGPTVLLLEYIPGELYIPSTQEEIASYFESLIEALHHLHRLGIVHHDVKPDNVMWEEGPNGRGVVLVDFGSAQLRPPGSSWILLDARGTRAFAAPEVLASQRCKHNVDIWSVGVMLFMMLLGIVPMDDGETVLAASKLSFCELTEWAATQNRLQDCALLTPKRWLLIQQMLNVNVAHRPTAAALHENFKSWYW